MKFRLVFVVLASQLLFVHHAVFGVDLTRTFSHTSGDAYAWIETAGEDTESSSSSTNCWAAALVVDYGDPSGGGKSYSSMNSTANAASEPATVVRVHGVTDTDSYLAGGYILNGVWNVGAIQSTTGTVETESTVTTQGISNHFISFSFTSGMGNNDQGSLYAWAKVGELQVYFNWSGGNTLSVSEYINGILDDSYDITDVNGTFTYSAAHDQTVVVGQTVEVDAFCVLVDNYNPWHLKKTVTVLAGTE